MWVCGKPPLPSPLPLPQRGSDRQRRAVGTVTTVTLCTGLQWQRPAACDTAPRTHHTQARGRCHRERSSHGTPRSQALRYHMTLRLQGAVVRGHSDSGQKALTLQDSPVDRVSVELHGSRVALEDHVRREDGAVGLQAEPEVSAGHTGHTGSEVGGGGGRRAMGKWRRRSATLS